MRCKSKSQQQQGEDANDLTLMQLHVHSVFNFVTPWCAEQWGQRRTYLLPSLLYCSLVINESHLWRSSLKFRDKLTRAATSKRGNPFVSPSQSPPLLFQGSLLTSQLPFSTSPLGPRCINAFTNSWPHLVVSFCHLRHAHRQTTSLQMGEDYEFNAFNGGIWSQICCCLR